MIDTRHLLKVEAPNNLKDTEETIVDPVCKMQIGPEQIKQSLIINGQPYYFCSVGCRAEFQRHPEDYIRREPKEGQHV
jgi:YHS domain-containing protein